MKFVIENTEYFFGETKLGKKSVVCKISGYWDTNVHTERNTYFAERVERLYCEPILDCMCGFENQAFTGKAVLSNGDEYDEESGKRIAESKAKASIMKATLKKNIDFCNALGDVTEKIREIIDRNANSYQKEIKHYNELIGEVEEE